MRLSECTKAELLWVIKRLCSHYLDQGNYYLARTLIDLEYEREKKRIDDAEKYAETAANATERYVQLMRPYEGQHLTDIPLAVLEEAEAILKEMNAADESFMKLLGIENGGRRC